MYNTAQSRSKETFSEQPWSAWRSSSVSSQLIAQSKSNSSASPSSAKLLSIGSRFGDKYEISSTVASGGMGTVFKGTQKEQGKVVAIKTLKSLESSPLIVSRFRHEARAARQLSHPNIIQLLDFGTDSDGVPFIVMDYVDGISLANLLKAEGDLKPAEAVHIFLQLADAMDYAHSQGILHRDLKPSNVMLTNLTGLLQAKIIDFGLAKFLRETSQTQSITAPGEILGSPYYMSPEQALGKKLDERTDVYSMGCMMYETLSGIVPLCGNTSIETLLKHISEKPIQLQTLCQNVKPSEELQNVVMRALEKEPDKRFKSMEQLKAALTEVPEVKNRNFRSGLDPGKTYRVSEKYFFAAGLCTSLLIALFIMQQLIPTPIAEINKVPGANIQKNETPFEPAYQKESVADNSRQPLTVPPSVAEYQPQTTWSFCSDQSLAACVRNYPTVTNLKLRDCSISDEGVLLLAPLHLRRLEVVQCKALTTTGYLSLIETHPSLEQLGICNADATDDIMPAIGRLAHLSSLSLNDMPKLIGNRLSSLPASLVTLSLSGDMQISPTRFAALSNLQNLARLDLSRSSVSPSALNNLSVLRNLKVLLLSRCPITDEGINSLLKFSKLEKLDLRKTFISRHGFFRLTGLKHLSDINIGDIPALNNEDAEAFEEKLDMRFCLIRPWLTNTAVYRSGSLTGDSTQVPKR